MWLVATPGPDQKEMVELLLDRAQPDVKAVVDLTDKAGLCLRVASVSDAL